MRQFRKGYLLILLTLAGWPGTGRAAESLADVERVELRRYLAELKQGQPGSAVQVERLAGMSFTDFRETVQAYVDLPGPIEAPTHRAFQALLERTSREALSPWPMVTLYSPDFARFLTAPVADNPLSRRLFQQLALSAGGRPAYDLAVRLCPEATLRHLAENKKEQRVELLEAWNRRLARGRERRPIANLDALRNTVAGQFALDRPVAELEAHLRFLAAWPELRRTYADCLRQCLRHDSQAVVLAGLSVQQRGPLRLDLNEQVIRSFADQPKVVEAALRNYGFDEAADHSAMLRRLWTQIPADQPKAGYECLFAMGTHPKGNDDIALAAVKLRAHDFIDVAMPILKRGDPEKARQAVRYVLSESDRGHEEALRLAHELKLKGFEADALKIAVDGQRDQILRQTAMHYLQLADGKSRRELLPLLAHPKADLRLTAIRAFAEKDGLAAADLNDIGPALIKVALTDSSMGHRQEAIYVIGCWRAPLALEFFRKVLVDNPPTLLTEGNYNDERYWQYRFRLMGLLGLVKLQDTAARKELVELHRQGGPAERMDVLLAFLDLGEVPDFAFGDLAATEPKLVATAATLIATHGDAAAKERMRRFFAESPLWREFIDSGIDDHNILRIVGLKKNDR